MGLYVIGGHGAGDPGAGGTASDGKRYDEAERVRTLGREIVARSGGKAVLLDANRNWYADGGVNAALKQLVGNSPVIELHTDAGGGSARGGHVIIKQGMAADRYDKALAAAISKRFPGRSETIVGRGNLANVNRAAANGINYRLLEVCFIDSRGDLDQFNAQMTATADDILRAFGITPVGATTTKPEEATVTAKQPTTKAMNDLGLWYAVHSAKLGWLAPVHDGMQAGTTGAKLGVQAFKLDFRKLPFDLVVDVTAHIQSIGQKVFRIDKTKHDTVIGTTGQDKRLEGFVIDVVSGLPAGKRLYCRVHVQGDGWTEWRVAGAFMGTMGEAKRIEAVEFVIM